MFMIIRTHDKYMNVSVLSVQSRVLWNVVVKVASVPPRAVLKVLSTTSASANIRSFIARTHMYCAHARLSSHVFSQL